jgi:hypothetical protein
MPNPPEANVNQHSAQSPKSIEVIWDDDKIQKVSILNHMHHSAFIMG